MAVQAPGVGDRVLDIGCGFGDTTRRLAELVGARRAWRSASTCPSPSCRLGDRRGRGGPASPTSATGWGTCRSQEGLGGPFDYVFSRMGVMFFANPVAGAPQRAPRRCGRAGGSASWSGGASSTTAGSARPSRWWRSTSITRGDQEPTCGPGPFSMAGADTVSEQLCSPGSRRSRCGAATCRSRSATTSTRRSSSTCRSGLRARCSASGKTASRRSPEDRGRDARRPGRVRRARRRPRPVFDLDRLRRRPG